MIKKRIAAALIIRDGIVVQSIEFKRFLPVGIPRIAVEFLNQWGIDEIILLDISATTSGRGPDLKMVREIAKSCFVPLAVGGGITTLDQSRELIRNGADKLIFNQSALHNPELLTQVADIFGRQCVIGSIDAINIEGVDYVYDYYRHQATPLDPSQFAVSLERAGAGEIYINSVNRDGAKSGFDINLIKKICESVDVPVICCGGVGVPQHFVEVFQATRVHAAVAANFFHFVEHSAIITKSVISRAGLPVRLDTHANYLGNSVDGIGRLCKKSDQFMEDLLYIRIEKEVI